MWSMSLLACSSPYIGTCEQSGRYLSYTSWLPCNRKVVGFSGCDSCVGSSDIGSMTGLVGAGAGFAFSSVISSSISCCNPCGPIKVGANRSMVLLRAWDGCAPDRELPCGQKKPEFLLSLRHNSWATVWLLLFFLAKMLFTRKG